MTGWRRVGIDGKFSRIILSMRWIDYRKMIKKSLIEPSHAPCFFSSHSLAFGKLGPSSQGLAPGVRALLQKKQFIAELDLGNNPIGSCDAFDTFDAFDAFDACHDIIWSVSCDHHSYHPLIICPGKVYLVTFWDFWIDVMKYNSWWNVGFICKINEVGSLLFLPNSTGRQIWCVRLVHSNSEPRP